MIKQSSIRICALTFLLITSSLKPETPYDLTVVSSIDFNGSVRRHAIGLIECLKEQLSINFIPSRECVFDDVDPGVKKIVQNTDRRPGNVAILEDPLWYAHAMPKSPIKLAFSVNESTKLPKQLVDILNKQFDAVIVADPYYKPIYKTSGVAIPIFHIPLGIYIDEFLKSPEKKAPNHPFVFGCSSRFFARKNFEILIKAFMQEFGNNKNVILRINGGGKHGSVFYYNRLKSMIKQLNASNILISNTALSWKAYIRFLLSMDCVVQISRGEGFSIVPREAMAAGIPAIVTNNTAQKTICASGFVRAVPSDILVSPHCKGDNCKGYQFNCTVADVRKALRDMYTNYNYYLALMPKARTWVKKYRWKNLRKKYLTLFKPQRVLLGNRNEVTATYLITTSKALYDKYKRLQSLNAQREKS